MKFAEFMSVSLSYYPNNFKPLPNGDQYLGFIPFQLSTQVVDHERYVYNLFDLLGDYGGFKQGLEIVIIILLLNYPEHQFRLSIM